MADVRLRAIRESDLPAIVMAVADPELRRWMPLLPDPYTFEMARADLARQTDAGRQWAVAESGTDRLLGGIQISAEGEIDYWTAPWGRGRGVASNVLSTVADWAFSHGYPRLYLTIHPGNTASQRVALRAGFRSEGVVPSARPAIGDDSGDRLRYVREKGQIDH
jgi:RimJ/RimL family protein N-acetyltransferase